MHLTFIYFWARCSTLGEFHPQGSNGYLPNFGKSGHGSLPHTPPGGMSFISHYSSSLLPQNVSVDLILTQGFCQDVLVSALIKIHPFLAVEALKRSKPEREVHCSTATWLVLTHCFWLFQECKPSTCQQHAPWTTRASHFSQSATDTWYSKIDQRLEQSQRRTGRSWRGRASLLC